VCHIECRVAGARSAAFAASWTAPVGIGPAKTTNSGEKLWKSRARVQYHVGQPDSPGPEWQLKVNFTPVIQRFFRN